MQAVIAEQKFLKSVNNKLVGLISPDEHHDVDKFQKQTFEYNFIGLVGKHAVCVNAVQCMEEV